MYVPYIYYMNMSEDISERSLIFYFRKSVKFKESLSYVNVYIAFEKL